MKLILFIVFLPLIVILGTILTLLALVFALAIPVVILWVLINILKEFLEWLI